MNSLSGTIPAPAHSFAAACRIVFLACIIACACALVSCSAPSADQSAQKQASPTGADATHASKPVVYASFFPVYDLTKRIVKDSWDVRTIIQGNQEPHDFELKAADMARLTKADLIIYNGAGMETFIPQLKESMHHDERFLDVSQGLTLLQNKDAKPQDHSSVNPHTWLSIKNALEQLDTLCKKFCALDSAHAAFYQENYQQARAEFEELDKQFAKQLRTVPAEKRYFVASHAAFNYLARDYGLTQVAVTGISPDNEPSAAQLAKIAQFVKAHNITTIFFEGSATPKVAETLARTTGARTSTLYTMEYLSEDDVNAGYLQLMKRNLHALMESFV